MKKKSRLGTVAPCLWNSGNVWKVGLIMPFLWGLGGTVQWTNLWKESPNDWDSESPLIEAQLSPTKNTVIIQNLWETGRPISTPRALTVLHGMTVFSQNQCASFQMLAVIGGSHPKPNREWMMHKLQWIVEDLMMKDLYVLNQSAKFVEMLLFLC